MRTLLLILPGVSVMSTGDIVWFVHKSLLTK
jgi:hypothetical protein